MPEKIEFEQRAQAVLRKCSYKKIFCKYEANLLQNTHAEANFTEITLRHWSCPVICCIFSEYLWRVPSEEWFIENLYRISFVQLSF